MGKKKGVKKTKELSVAIAESSSIGEEPQQQTPRKRGRPRKVVEKTEQEVKEELESAAANKADEGLVEENESKIARISVKEVEDEDDDDKEQKRGGASAAESEKQVSEKQPSRSRARRKSKPRKSS